jgi:hypothetical protein
LKRGRKEFSNDHGSMLRMITIFGGFRQFSAKQIGVFIKFSKKIAVY